jgi:hypothetical protein
VNSMFVSWMQSTKLKADFTTVQGYQTVKQHFHFQNHLSLLQDTRSNDDHVKYDSMMGISKMFRNFM